MESLDTTTDSSSQMPELQTTNAYDDTQTFYPLLEFNLTSDETEDENFSTLHRYEVMKPLNCSMKFSPAGSEFTAIPPKSFLNYLIYTVVWIILLVNSTLVVVYLVQRLRKPSKFRLKPAGLLVLNLLIADLLFGALHIAIYFMKANLKNELSELDLITIILAIISMHYIARMESNIAVFNVAVDRYIAVAHPLHYKSWVTLTRSTVVLLVGWTVPLIVAGYCISNFPCLLPANIHDCLLLCKTKTLYTFQTYIRVPSHILMILSIVVLQCLVFISLRCYEKESINQAGHRISQKSARSLFWVITFHIIFWIPFDLFWLRLLKQDESDSFYRLSVLLAFCSLFINPCIFSYRTESIRKPVSDFLCDLKIAMTWKKDQGQLTNPNDQTMAQISDSVQNSSKSGASNKTEEAEV